MVEQLSDGSAMDGFAGVTLAGFISFISWGLTH